MRAEGVSITCPSVHHTGNRLRLPHTGTRQAATERLSGVKMGRVRLYLLHLGRPLLNIFGLNICPYQQNPQNSNKVTDPFSADAMLFIYKNVVLIKTHKMCSVIIFYCMKSCTNSMRSLYLSLLQNDGQAGVSEIEEADLLVEDSSHSAQLGSLDPSNGSENGSEEGKSEHTSIGRIFAQTWRDPALRQAAPWRCRPWRQ